MNDPLAARFEALLEPGRPDWLDVQRRARRRLRRIWLVAAVAAVFLAVPTVAIALDPSILPWNSAQPAPAPVVDSFATLTRGAPPGMDPHLRPGEARTVPLPDGGTVWIAPAADGGFCEDFKGEIAGCDQAVKVPINLSLGDAGSVACGETAPPAIVLGHVNAQPGSTLQLVFSDGSVSSLPLIWVGPPINAGFFEQHVPQGRRMTALVLRDPAGSVLAKETDMFQGFYTPSC
jgi:hypothetical protein